eukprot:CAMPEP_0170064116 /NCGR_PEP_ID=MMETSP0019_2-20121128/4725_1 /TAXON_ID=98059 /ORGANISM="Dinobryon sp., Strain UTEXLB2267" /LENGTH=671 /DNA_ID=CAMNT_0010270707 /DNA_START=55 /DNA_END=2071 /DNA_ORIENTATION=-
MTNKVQTPLQYKKIWILGLILSVNNTSMWMIFSFLPFMVAHFYPSLPSDELGYKTGLLGSAYSAGGLIGNIVWGAASDRYGRRPVLLCGLIGTAISSICFGFSLSYPIALFFRFLWGLLNGNIGVAKTYLAEISDDSNSARGMALYAVIGGSGRIVGPLLGGLLYNAPCGPVLAPFPLALPSLAVAAYCGAMLLLALLTLQETLPARAQGEEVKDDRLLQARPIPICTAHPLSGPGPGWLQWLCPPAGPRGPADPPDQYRPLHTCEQAEQEPDWTPSVELAPLQRDPERGPSRRVWFLGEVTVKTIDEPGLSRSPLKQVFRDDIPRALPAPAPRRCPRPAGPMAVTWPARPAPPRTGPAPSASPSPPGPCVYSTGAEFFLGASPSGPGLWGVLRRREVCLGVLLYFLGALAVTVTAELFPLWAPLALGYGAREIGLATMLGGAGAALLQLGLYPSLAEALGVSRLFRLGTLLLALCCGLLPAVTRANPSQDPGLQWVPRLLALLLQLGLLAAANWLLVSVFVLLNNCCYSHQRASVNALGQSCASLGRLLGPLLWAPLFAWSRASGVGWPGLAWYAVTAVALLAGWLSGLLPRGVERQKREPRLTSPDPPTDLLPAPTPLYVWPPLGTTKDSDDDADRPPSPGPETPSPPPNPNLASRRPRSFPALHADML